MATASNDVEDGGRLQLASEPSDGRDHREFDLISNDELAELAGDDEDHTDENEDEAADNDHQLSLRALRETNLLQQEEILNLQQELNQLKVQHKEGIYWLQMQLDTTRREKVAIEESMAELQEDLKDMAIHDRSVSSKDYPENGENTTMGGDGSDGKDVHAQKRKYELSLGTLENQITMIKTSFGEISKSLKEEISDLMEDRTQIELNLLNQLSALDDERRKKELELTLQLTEKEEEIQRLQQERPPMTLPKSDDNNDNYSTATSILSFEDDNHRSLLELLLTKGQRDELLERERREADEIINDLKDQKIELERRLETAECDLTSMRSKANRRDNAKQLLSQLALQKKNIDSTLDRVLSMKKSADTTIQSLGEITDKFQSNDDDAGKNEKEERKQALSIMESASLLNGQIKISLVLVELQLRNHLEQIKNCDTGKSLKDTSRVDEDLSKKLEEMNSKALTSLKQVETVLFEQMKALEVGILEENKTMAETLTELQNDCTELKAELTMLRKSPNGSPDFNKSQETALTRSTTISESMLEQLSMEVFRVVATFSNLKETIANLKMELAKHVKREDNLRKELKRAIRAKAVLDGSPLNVGTTTPTSHRSSLTVRQRVRKNSEALKVPFLANEADSPFVIEMSSPFSTPTQSRSSRQTRRNSTGSAIVDSTPAGITPLKPSPKELFKSKKFGHYNSQFLVKAPPFTPTKSPTGVDAGFFEDIGI